MQGVKSQALAFLRAKGRAEEVRAARMRTGGKAAAAKADQAASSLSPAKEGSWRFSRISGPIDLTAGPEVQANGAFTGGNFSCVYFIGGDNLAGMRLIQLLALAEATDFQINWLSISMNHLDERHSLNECMG